MARLVPADPPDGMPYSERTVLAALATLPDPWIVVIDIPIGVFTRPRPGLEQIDFLLVHPGLGLAVIEVKGGQITIEEGKWFTTPHGTITPKPLRRTPFQQAADQRFELQRFLWKRLNIPDQAMAHGVALPGCHVESSLGPEAPRDLVIDADDLHDIAEPVARIMRKWQTSLTVSDEEVERLLDLLKPSMSMTIVLARQTARIEQAIERETRKQVDFSESQVDAYSVMLRHERALVMGEAGTGKTVLAVERAKRLAGTGSRTLLLCHRSAVFSAILTLLADLNLPRQISTDPDVMLTAAHWTGLRRFLEDKGGQLPSANASSMPDAMLAAAEKAGLQFDAIVVDEGQEFTPNQIEGLTWLLTDPEDGPLYFFADPFQHSGIFTASHLIERQQLRGSYDWQMPLEMPVVNLIDNVRNAMPVADNARNFVKQQRSRAVVPGRVPQEILCKKRSEVVARGAAEIDRLLSEEGFSPNQLLAVLVGVDETDFASQLRRLNRHAVSVSQLTRFPLTPADLRVAHGYPDLVQGLEAEVVVAVIWQDGPMSVGDVRDLYVAMTRARSHLIVISNRYLAQLGLAARVAFEAADREVTDDDDE
jgi:hypothetical protein